MVGMKKSKSAERVEDKPAVEETQSETETTQVNEGATNEPQNNKEKDGIRRIIKLGPEKNGKENSEVEKTDVGENKVETSNDAAQQVNEERISETAGEANNKTVEKGSSSEQIPGQQQVLLQNLKDFDFQLKKNQEEIKNLSEKVESISKDLDDLVSLYEIVSEQMNPFVGLSKVTKQRLEALENFTSEIRTLKERLEELEVSIGKTPPPQSEDVSKMEDTSAVEGKISPDADTVVGKALDVVTFEEKLDDVIDNFLKELM